MYTVSANITNGTAASVQVASGGTATLTVIPDSGYINPTGVSVSSGTCGTPTISSATITVPNVTSNVIIAATCPVSSSLPFELWQECINGTLTWVLES